MRRRVWAWGVPAAVLALVALGGLYAITTPRFSLYRLGVAMQRHDVALAERYFDVERVTDGATDVLVADYFARQPKPTTEAEVNGRQLAATIARRRLRPQVLTRVRGELRRSVERAGLQPVSVALPLGLVGVMRGFQVSGYGSEVWVTYRDPVQGPIRFRMSRQPDWSWRISEFDPDWVRRRAQEAPSRLRAFP